MWAGVLTGVCSVVLTGVLIGVVYVLTGSAVREGVCLSKSVSVANSSCCVCWQVGVAVQ